MEFIFKMKENLVDGQMNWQTVSVSDRQKAICIDIAVSVKALCQIEKEVGAAEFTLYKKFDR